MKKCTSFLVNADLVYANFTNMTFQKITISHLTLTMKYALSDYDVRLLLTFAQKTKVALTLLNWHEL